MDKIAVEGKKEKVIEVPLTRLPAMPSSLAYIDIHCTSLPRPTASLLSFNTDFDLSLGEGVNQEALESEFLAQEIPLINRSHLLK